jgi:hypothetical protein
MDKDMFSGLGQILKPVTRRAEETDTHLYLQKHERDQNRKKRDQENDKGDYFDIEDRASVSVDALYAFITNMLGNSGSDVNSSVAMHTDQPLYSDGPQQGETVSPPNTKTAKAAGAYAHAAETAGSRAYTPSSKSDNADSGENQFLHDLLEEIESLRARNIQEIYIEKADTFQESLINAIMRAKEQ